MGEVESHVAGLVVGASLVRVRAQHVAQRRVDDVRRRVRLRCAAAVVGVDARLSARVNSDRADRHLHGVHDETRHRLLHVEHLGLEAVADDHAVVGILTARLREQCGLGEHELGDLTLARLHRWRTVDDDAEHLALVHERVVANERGLAESAQLLVDGEIGALALLRLRVSLCAVALLLHERREHVAVDRNASFLGDLERQLHGEPVGVVEQERGISVNARRRAGLRLGHCGLDGAVQDLNAARERAQEGLLLGVRDARDEVEVLGDLGVGVLHGVARHWEELSEAWAVHAEQAHRQRHAPQQATQDVPAALVGRRHAVSDQHEPAADVIGDDAQAHVVVNYRAVRLTGEFGGAIEHRANLVDLVHVLHALLDERDALEAHARIDVLLRQVAHDREVELRLHVGDLVLHEHEVPDLHVAVVVGRRAAVNTVLGAEVEEDLRARARRTGLACRPVVRVLAKPLDAVVGQRRVLLPQRERLVVFLVDGDPEVVRREPEAAVGLRRREELPGEPDRALLEVVAEREVAAHLEERAVARGLADLFDVVGADALLHARRTVVGRGHQARQVRHERHHAGHSEHQARVITHERGRGHNRVASLLEEVQPAALNLCGLHVRCFVPL